MPLEIISEQNFYNLTKTNMKKQSKFLIGGIVTVVIIAGVLFATNTDLFKGSLRGGEKGKLPKVTETRCKMFKDYQDKNGYAALVEKLLKGKSEYVNACKEKYSNMWFTPDQQYAKTQCEKLNGAPHLAFSDLYGKYQLFCSFGGGECTEGELNKNVCFMETNQAYKTANEKCAELDGSPYLAFNEEYGEDQVFCLFANEEQCTQNELNNGKCFKDQ